MFFCYLLVFMSGFILSFIFIINDIKEIETEKYNAESRELITLLKLNKIKQIIEKSDYIKENYFTTIEKIKEVISSDQTNK